MECLQQEHGKESDVFDKRNSGVFIVIEEEERNDPIKIKRWMEKEKE